MEIAFGQLACGPLPEYQFSQLPPSQSFKPAHRASPESESSLLLSGVRANKLNSFRKEYAVLL